MTSTPEEQHNELTELNIHPNPTNYTTTIEFELPVPGDVLLSICNISGQEVHLVFIGKKEREKQTFKCDSKDFPGGIYFIKLQTDKGLATPL